MRGKKEKKVRIKGGEEPSRRGKRGTLGEDGWPYRPLGAL